MTCNNALIRAANPPSTAERRHQSATQTSQPPRSAEVSKADSSRANRAYLSKRGIKAVIPEKEDQAANRKRRGRPGGRALRHDAELYKERNTVERLINRMKDWRGIATRFDKTPENYLAGLELRASMIWIDDLLRATH